MRLACVICLNGVVQVMLFQRVEFARLVIRSLRWIGRIDKSGRISGVPGLVSVDVVLSIN